MICIFPKTFAFMSGYSDNIPGLTPLAVRSLFRYRGSDEEITCSGKLKLNFIKEIKLRYIRYSSCNIVVIS